MGQTAHVEVQVRLYSILRERLSPGAKGIVTVTMPEKATVADLLSNLQIDLPVVVVVNKSQARDRQEILRGGDSVLILPPATGG